MHTELVLGKRSLPGLYIATFPLVLAWLSLRERVSSLVSLFIRALIGFPSGSDGKESACNAGDLDSISGSERSPGEGNGYPLQYSCMEKSMNRGAWWAIAHGVSKSWT